MKKTYLYFVLAFILLTYSSALAQNKPTWATKINISELNNLYQVSDSVFRSEQPMAKDFKKLYKFGIKSVLNLRTGHKDNDLISKHKMNLFHIPMTAAYMDLDNFINALKIIYSAPKPILIHCQHGSDRTGALIALYRIVFQNWSKADAIEEMKKGNYGFHSIYINIPVFINDLDIELIKKQVFN